MNRRLVLLAAAIAPAVYALLMSGANVAFAYPMPQGSAKLVSGCTTLAPGASCDYTFQFLDAGGSPSPNLGVEFAARMVKGCTVIPHSGTTDAGGTVTTTLSCSPKSGTGTVTLTAKSGKVSASADVTIAAHATALSAHPAVSNSSAAAGSSGPWVLIGGALLAAVLVASMCGGYVARRTRRARL